MLPPYDYTLRRGTARRYLFRVLRLTTFGGIVLRQDGGPHAGAASQRRRLALLAITAAAAGRPVSREKLLAFLWPESDTERARHALSQSLHAIQRALDVEGLFVGTDSVHLEPALITSDVQDVEEAAEQGAHQRVVGLMKGPFLDGFHINDAPEFERWVEAQRMRFAGQFVASLEALAVEASARADHGASAAWWRRLTAEQPTNARYVAGLMKALADAGDRVGALLQASVYEAAVRDEWDSEPDPIVTTLAEQLRGAREADTGQPVSAGAAAAAATLSAARERAQDRQRAWLDRALGDRYVIEAGIPSRGAIVGYQAYDRKRQIRVELQLLDPGLSALADVDALMARLDRIATLREPHLIPMYEYGSVDGIVFFTVARPDGESLQMRLRRERQLPLRDSLATASDIAAGLAHAHDAGVLHADLRPKHVFLVGGSAVVAGIGIAEALMTATTKNRTSSPLRMGSPDYQSPEQLLGEPLDARSDVYSLGCIMYEMLAGEVPFASQARGVMVSGRLTSAVPSLAARRDTVSAELSALVARCLARSASDRYRTAGEVAAALRAMLVL